jgi:hypothetical protein
MEWNWPPDFETAAPPKWDTQIHNTTIFMYYLKFI